MRQVKDGLCNTAFTNSAGTVTRVVYEAFSAGSISGSGFAASGMSATPATISAGTTASGASGSYTYRWVRIGTSNNTYTVNSMSHVFTAAELNAVGTYTYYREVHDNICNTTTWSRSSGSYILTVLNCLYKGSDLYYDETHLCQQRTSGAGNWEAYIKDVRDNQIYRIVQMPTNTWWMANDLLWDGKPYPEAVNYTVRGTPRACGEHYDCGRFYTASLAGSGIYAGVAADRWTGDMCPPGWLGPSNNELQPYVGGAERAQYVDARVGKGDDPYGLSLGMCGDSGWTCGTNQVTYRGSTCAWYWLWQQNTGACSPSVPTAESTGHQIRCVRD
jgi:uncharacterized protein (TIGR02145 family)